MGEIQAVIELWQRGEREAAERALQALREARPDDPDVLGVAADLHAATGRQPEAIAIWRSMADGGTADAVVLRKLGGALLDQGDARGAVAILGRAVTADPANPRGLNNYGLALLRAGEPGQALEQFAACTRLLPGYVLAYFHGGLAHEALGQLLLARDWYERALALDPHLAPARLQLSALLERSDRAAARREADRARESDAINLMTVRRYAEAATTLTELIESGAELPYLEGTRLHCHLQVADWRRYDEHRAAMDSAVAAGRPAILPFSYFVHTDSAAAQQACSRIYTRQAFPALPAVHREPPLAGRIRVAYVSFDFHEHATAYLLAGLLEAHDRSRFEVVAYSYGPDDSSAMRARLARAVDEFVDVRSLSDAEIAETIAARGVHVLIDLKGHTGGARTGIFARRPAPIQINFLGYPGTMGAPYMDYIVADRHVIPATQRHCYDEAVIEMPICYQPNDPARPRPSVAPDRARYGLPDNGLVFGAFNSAYKIAPELFGTWMAILGDHPGSCLWLLDATEDGNRNLRAAAVRHGIAAERLVFAPLVSQVLHLERYRHVDLFLDTWPCNGHTTVSDALWMGVPVVTLTGQAFPGRVATSLLSAVGLGALCATTPGEYRAIVATILADPLRLGSLRSHLRDPAVTAAVFDSQRYGRDLESALVTVVDRYRSGAAVSTLVVG